MRMIKLVYVNLKIFLSPELWGERSSQLEPGLHDSSQQHSQYNPDNYQTNYPMKVETLNKKIVYIY